MTIEFASGLLSYQDFCFIFPPTFLSVFHDQCAWNKFDAIWKIRKIIGNAMLIKVGNQFLVAFFKPGTEIVCVGKHSLPHDKVHGEPLPFLEK